MPRSGPKAGSAGRLAVLRAAALVSALAAFAADFPWGDFQNHTHWAKVGWIPFVSPPVRLLDMAQNLLLFAPVGFFIGLEAWVERSASPSRLAARAALITFVVSFLGEWSQLYSHTRFPSATDLACNVIGAVAAAVILARPHRQGHARLPGWQRPTRQPDDH